MLDGTDEVKTINYLAKFDAELQLLGVEPLVDSEHDLEWHDFPVRGWEDMRLFEFEGEWYATAASRELDPDGVCRTVLLAPGRVNHRIGSRAPRPRPPSPREELDAVLPRNGELLFVYSCGPTIVTRVDPAGGDPDAVRHARGARSGERTSEAALKASRWMAASSSASTKPST